MGTSKYQAALDALSKVEELREEAIAEINAEIAVLQEQLSKLQTVSGSVRKPSKIVSKRSVNSEKSCDLCGFRTEPIHDKRAHRHQEPKKSFSDAELKEKGLKKV
jgi:ribosomal protein L29